MPQGLALHQSLAKHAGSFTLWVICVDDLAKKYLDQRALENLKTIALNDVETPDLLRVKGERSRAEYCWTLTPFAPKFVFDRDPSISRVTYLDADLFLLKSPKPIFFEFDESNKSVLITDHAYDPEYDHSASSGQYCVQFMTFKHDSGAERVRQWWQDKCIEWCYARAEDGKFGDQKYLDCWPNFFHNEVHVLKKINAILAPWNAKRYPYSNAIVWHFHGLRILNENRYLLYENYYIPKPTYDFVYKPYIDLLTNIKKQIPFAIIQAKSPTMLSIWAKGIREILSRIIILFRMGGKILKSRNK